MLRQGWKSFAILLLSTVLLAGCSATTTFLPYPYKISPLKEQLTAATPADLAATFKSERKSNDKLLYTLEHGRAAQLLGQTGMSRDDFSVAIAVLRADEERAVISASRIGANLAAFATNDNALPYRGEGYERVLLHHFQAFNYLLDSDLSGAGVEFRWANAEQQEALTRHEKELEKVDKEAQRKGVSRTTENSEFQRRYAQLDEAAGQVKNSFQNAYSFYLSGVVYELQGEANDAYIDYKKALEIYPQNSFLQRDVVRLAKRLQMEDDLADLAKRFPALYNEGQEERRDGEGELILFFEDGFVPQREELKISFFIVDGAVSLAFPYYRGPWRTPQPLEVSTETLPPLRTELLCDVRALAVKSLQEKLPILLVRQVIRAVSKGVLQRQAKEKYGALGELGMMAYSIVSENADLRSWLTLPEDVQLLRMKLPVGKNRLRLQVPGSLYGEDLTIDIRNGGKTIVRVARTGNRFHSAMVSY